MLVASDYQVSGGSYNLVKTYNAYFDGVNWSRFEPQHTSLTPFINTVALSVPNKKTGYSNIPRTYFVVTHEIANVKSYTIYYYDRWRFGGEYNKVVAWEMTLKDLSGPNWWIVKRAKKLFVSMFATQATFEMEATVNGDPYLLGPFAASGKFISGAGNTFWTHAMPSVYNSLVLKFAGFAGYDEFGRSNSPMKFKGMAVAMNTDTRSIPDREVI